MLSNKEIVALVDHTRLSVDDSNEFVVEFCKKAISPFGNCAAVCVYPKYIPAVQAALKNSSIKIATVVNFPHGNPHLEHCLSEIELCLQLGADEIDIVMPYHELQKGEHEFVAHFIHECKKHCKDKATKLIIESGALTDEEIKIASELAIDAGIDFIKTSTGKIAKGATPEAVKIIADTIKNKKAQTGIKVSGGVRTRADVEAYLSIIQKSLGDSWFVPEKLRFGASQLLDNL